MFRGLDGIFLRPPPAVRLFALVQAGSDLEGLARRILPSTQVLPYQADEPLGPYPSTEQILTRSPVASLLRHHGIGALFLSASCSPGTLAWSQQHGIALLMTEYDEQRRLEDKLWFDRYLQRLGLPRPPGGSFRLGRDPLPRRGRAVLQIGDSMGGEGTFFVRGARDIRRLQDEGTLTGGQRYLLRRFIPGRPFGITVFVDESAIQLSAVRLQCYYPTQAGSSQRGFAGIQWVATGALAPRLQRRINQTFLALGRALHRRRALGFANVDFMVDASDRIYILECNARMSAATPQLLAHPELIAGPPPGPRFLQRFAQPGRCARTPVEWPMPDSTFVGATLDLMPQQRPSSPDRPAPAPRVRRAYRSGQYRARDGAFAFSGSEMLPPPGPDDISLFFFAERGQICAADDTLGTVLTSAPLYDSQGDLLPLASQILAYFRPTAAVSDRSHRS